MPEGILVGYIFIMRCHDTTVWAVFPILLASVRDSLNRSVMT